ncbi:MAG TPA: hypothetical protein VFP65_07790 [Anaeromyxobacteraceae bacterium]|nr:hypothetical protein [Anaeromyxobacteraceae bacterium]
MTPRTTTLIALLLGSAACATMPAVPGPGKHTISGPRYYRLELQVSDTGEITSAQAYDKSNKPVATKLVPLKAEMVCVPDQLDTAASVVVKAPDGASLYCDPWLSVPPGISLVSGTGTLCHYYQGNQVVYYSC